MNRRSFLKGILAAGVAPFVVTSSGVLMPVRQLWSFGESSLELIGDGIVNDTAALQAWINGSPVLYQGRILGHMLYGGIFKISDALDFSRAQDLIINSSVFSSTSSTPTQVFKGYWRVGDL